MMTQKRTRMKKASLLIPHQSTKLLVVYNDCYKENNNVLVPRIEKGAIDFAICGAGGPRRSPPPPCHADAGRHAAPAPVPAPARASQREREAFYLCAAVLALALAPRRARSCMQACARTARAVHGRSRPRGMRVYVRSWIVAVV